MPLIAVILAWVVKTFTWETIKFLLLKGMLILALYIVLPLVLYNLQAKILGEVLAYTIGRLDASLPSQGFLYNVGGILGWMALKLKIPDCINVLLAALNTKWIIALIPRPTSIGDRIYWTA